MPLPVTYQAQCEDCPARVGTVRVYAGNGTTPTQAIREVREKAHAKGWHVSGNVFHCPNHKPAAPTHS